METSTRALDSRFLWLWHLKSKIRMELLVKYTFISRRKVPVQCGGPARTDHRQVGREGGRMEGRWDSLYRSTLRKGRSKVGSGSEQSWFQTGELNPTSAEKQLNPAVSRFDSNI